MTSRDQRLSAAETLGAGGPAGGQSMVATGRTAAIGAAALDAAAIAGDFAGVVLAAGRSTRMGRDKALLEVDGVPLWRRQRDVLRAAGAAEVYVSARPEQAWTHGATSFAGVLHDAFRDGGPIVGITAALERSGRPWLAVLAIDLPHLPAAWFATLRAEASAGVGVVGRRGDHFEPLAALYPAELKWSAWELVARGEFSLQRLIAQAVRAGLLRVHELTPAETPWFANWNTPEDARAAQA